MSSQLGFTDSVGQVKVDAGALVAPVYRGGLAFNAAGRLYVTTVVAATDAFNNGLRVSATGQLVVSSPAAPSQPYVYSQGLPKSKVDGSLIRTVDGAINASAGYVGGVRVDDTNGVYMTLL